MKILLKQKSNRYMILCILLLFLYSSSPISLFAAELPSSPIEHTTETPTESIPSPAYVSSKPLFSNMTLILLFLAILAILISIIFTLISLFRLCHHSFDDKDLNNK